MTELAEMVLLGRLRKGALDKYLAGLLVMSTYVSARWENKPPSKGLQGKHIPSVVEIELPQKQTLQMTKGRAHPAKPFLG